MAMVGGWCVGRRCGPSRYPWGGTVGQLSGLRLEAAQDKGASRLWNGLIERYHYLGYTPLPGAQLRYLIHCEHGVLGAIGFGAAAWKVAARDRWIGWETACREAHLGRVLNNARRGEKIEFAPHEAERYKARSQAERVNSLLKDNHGGRHVRVRGAPKVYTHLMFGILVIAAEQILRLLN
jgi:hypothetical protein